MSELAVYGSGIIEAQPVKNDLLTAFVSYIDRSPKTARTYLTNLRQFIAWLRYSGITQPARPDIISYREWLSAEHDAIQMDTAAPNGWQYRTDNKGNRQRVQCKPNTVKQYLQSVKQFFSWAAAEGLYSIDIAKGIHGPKITAAHRKDSLTAEEVQAIEQSIDRSTEQGKRLFALYSLAVNAGLRTIEISRANLRDLETKNGAASLRIWGKGHAEPDAIKPLAPEVYAAIKDYISSRTDNPTGSSPLFVATGNRSGGKRIAATTISTMLKRAMQAAGFDSERLTAHSLRHTAGQNVMQITGRNIYETQQYMRHANPATTEIYLDNDSTQQDGEIARRLYAHYHGQQAGNDAADRIQAAMQHLTPEQLEQLANIAEAMQKGGR